MVPETVAPEAGEVMETVGGVVSPVLLTVTETAELVALLPAVSMATAVRECLPLISVAVLRDTEYGALVSRAPRFEPSTWNCTLATATLSEALAVTVMVPETVAPEAGEVMETLGGVVSALFTVMETAELVALLPAVSMATAVRECLPLVSVPVLRDAE